MLIVIWAAAMLFGIFITIYSLLKFEKNNK